jgi:excisionase family DNA binding protein
MLPALARPPGPANRDAEIRTTAARMADGRDNADRLYRVAEAAAALGMSERTLRRRVQSGAIEAVRDGTAYRIPGRAIAAAGGQIGRGRASDRADAPATARSKSAAGPATPAPDAAAFLATIERMAAEQARLAAALATAEERLRQLEAETAVRDAVVTQNKGPGRAKMPEPDSDAFAGFWSRIRRWLAGG